MTFQIIYLYEYYLQFQKNIGINCIQQDLTFYTKNIKQNTVEYKYYLSFCVNMVVSRESCTISFIVIFADCVYLYDVRDSENKLSETSVQIIRCFEANFYCNHTLLGTENCI